MTDNKANIMADMRRSYLQITNDLCKNYNLCLEETIKRLEVDFEKDEVELTRRDNVLYLFVRGKNVGFFLVDLTMRETTVSFISTKVK